MTNAQQSSIVAASAHYSPEESDICLLNLPLKAILNSKLSTDVLQIVVVSQGSNIIPEKIDFRSDQCKLRAGKDLLQPQVLPIAVVSLLLTYHLYEVCRYAI